MYCVPATDWFILRYPRYSRAFPVTESCAANEEALPARGVSMDCICFVLSRLGWRDGLGSYRWQGSAWETARKYSQYVLLLVNVQHTHSVKSHPVCWEYRRAAEGWHARAAAVRGAL
jgi:hypothetical protein